MFVGRFELIGNMTEKPQSGDAVGSAQSTKKYMGSTARGSRAIMYCKIW